MHYIILSYSSYRYTPVHKKSIYPCTFWERGEKNKKKLKLKVMDVRLRRGKESEVGTLWIHTRLNLDPARRQSKIFILPAIWSTYVIMCGVSATHARTIGGALNQDGSERVDGSGRVTTPAHCSEPALSLIYFIFEYLSTQSWSLSYRAVV